MSMLFQEKKVPVSEKWQRPFVWAVLILALAASFAAGVLIGREQEPTPLIIDLEEAR
ncbi:MAG: hypothetical protein Q8P88_02815 [Candidatus Jorgensenbacteria bacterium]|nr:hypothetical protein [Candidatus Jorgensenbacteria bacterium]